jgi:quinol monooxygenase YgiN
MSYDINAPTDSLIISNSKGEKTMWVRVTSIRVSSGKADEMRKIYNEEIVPVAKQQKGNKGIYLLEPAGGQGEFLSCTAWETKEDADAYNGKYSGLVDKIRHCLTGEPTLKEYELKQQSATAAHS